MQGAALEQALTTPESVFGSPCDVTADPSLDQQTKIDILAAWMANEKAQNCAPARHRPMQNAHLRQVVTELKKLRL